MSCLLSLGSIMKVSDFYRNTRSRAGTLMCCRAWPHLRQKVRQSANFDVLEMCYRVCDLPPQSGWRIRLAELIEFFKGRFPGKRPCMKSFVVSSFPCQYPAIPQMNCDATGHFLRESLAIGFVRPHCDISQQHLHHLPLDMLRKVLTGHHLAVDNRCSHQVRQAVVGFFLGSNNSFSALLSAANDVVGDIKHFDIDVLHLGSIEPVLTLHLQHRVKNRLRMNLGIIFLYDGSVNALEVFARPVNLKTAGDCIHEAFVAFKDLGWSRDAPHSKKHGMKAAEGGVGIR